MRKLGYLVMPIMAISLLASCGGGTPAPETYDVTCSDSNVNISNPNATQGKDYTTNLTTKSEDLLLPESLTKVTIGETETNEYSYSLINNVATFSVNAQYVTGPINIELDLINLYNVTCTEGVNLGNPRATEGEKYETTLTVNSGVILPAKEAISVYVGGSEESLKTDEFTYEVRTDNPTIADFSIDGEKVNGSINIKVPYKYKVTVSEGINITSGTEQFEPKTEYTTTLSVGEGTKLPEKGEVKVFIDNHEYEGFTYDKDPDEKSAQFSIKGDDVTGPINIQLDYLYIVQVNEGVKLGTKAAKKGENYITTLEVNNGVVLPSRDDVTVTIGGEDYTGFEYSIRQDNLNIADLSIVAQDVTGLIEIKVPYQYKVSVHPSDVTIPEKDLVVEPNTFYETTLTVNGESKFMPEDQGDVTVTIGGEPYKDFAYEVDEEDKQKASFSIPANDVTGPIDISIKIGEYLNVTVTNGVTIDEEHKQAIKNQDYRADLSVDGDAILPEKEKIEVSVGTSKITEFGYEKNGSNKATFYIEASLVTDDIKIDVPYYFNVTSDNEVTLTNDKATYNTKYETKINAKYEAILPENVAKVMVNGESISDESSYTYARSTDKKSATFSLNAEKVTGPVQIDLDISHEYIAYVSSANDEKLSLSNKKVELSNDFETNISFIGSEYPNKKLPSTVNVSIGGVPLSSNDFTYTLDSSLINIANLKIAKEVFSDKEGNVAIYFANGLADRTKWYEFADWWNYCSEKKDEIPIATADDVGRTVSATVNYGKSYDAKIRLIDINHDTFIDGTTKVHCTFEFTTIICFNRLADLIKWGDDSKYFTRYEINKKSNDVLSLLTGGLQAVIKPVIKGVGEGDWGKAQLISYQTKFFPLSAEEFGTQDFAHVDGEGTVYSFYNKGGSIEKFDLSGSKRSYWARSPIIGGYSVLGVSQTYLESFSPDNEEHCYAPAFCI